MPLDDLDPLSLGLGLTLSEILGLACFALSALIAAGVLIYAVVEGLRRLLGGD